MKLPTPAETANRLHIMSLAAAAERVVTGTDVDVRVPFSTVEIILVQLARLEAFDQTAIALLKAKTLEKRRAEAIRNAGWNWPLIIAGAVWILLMLGAGWALLT